MDFVQNGESSRPITTAATTNSHTQTNGDINGDVDMDVDTNTKPTPTHEALILPQWDVPSPKPLHQSLDLISLLNLDGYFNTYVRPFADESSTSAGGISGSGIGSGMEEVKPLLNGVGTGVVPPPIGIGKKGNKKKKLEKGYQHLLEDCIDPTPLGAKADSHSLLPLVNDLTYPPTGPPPNLPYLNDNGKIEILPMEMFKVARLEVGLKQEGYAGGEKLGVRQAEERRRKKRAGRALTVDPSLPSPIPGPPLASPGLTQPRTATPGTPLLPVPPPRAFPLNTTRRPTAPPSLGGQGQGQGPVRPFPQANIPTQAGPTGPTGPYGARPYAPNSNNNKRPGSVENQFGPQNPKRPKGLASRSASPLPSIQQQQTTQQRKLPPGMRSRTEGL